MLITREHSQERFENICYVHEIEHGTDASTHTALGIDVNRLAWLYFDPGTSHACCQRLLQTAAELMVTGSWAVIQIDRTVDRARLEDAGFRIMESFENQTPGDRALEFYLVRKAA